MRSSGGGGALVFLLVVAYGIFQAIFEMFQWLAADWHWFQIAGPLLLITAVTVALAEKLDALPDWLKALWGLMAAIVPAAGGVLSVNTQLPVGPFLSSLPVWLLAGVGSLLYCPVAFYELGKFAERSAEDRARRQARLKEKPHRPFGTAGKVSDDRLRELGMI